MEWNKKGNAHYDLEGRRHRPEDRSGHSRRTFSKGEIASKRAQTELARSQPSGSDFFKIPEEKQETDGTGLCEDGIAESRDFFCGYRRFYQ